MDINRQEEAMEHERWKTGASGDEWLGLDRDDGEYEPVAMFYGPKDEGAGGPVAARRAKRALECHNACAGIANPEALPELIAAAKKVASRSSEPDYAALRAALAELEPPR